MDWAAEIKELFAIDSPDPTTVTQMEQYRDYRSGMWSKSVFHFITTCFESREFPEVKEIIA